MIKNDFFWEERYRSNPDYRNEFPFSQVVSFLAQNRKSGEQKLLEVGCGSGCNLWAASTFGFETYGIDISETILEYADQFLGDRGVSSTLVKGSFDENVFPDNTFDIILDRSSIHCADIDKQGAIIKNIFNLLKPGGLFYFNPAGDENSSFKVKHYPVQKITTDNDFFGKNVSLVYYNEQAIREMCACFELVQIKKVVTEIKGESPKIQTFSEFEVICMKPQT